MSTELGEIAANEQIDSATDVNTKIQTGAGITGTASGTDTYALTLAPAITAYAIYQTFGVLFTNGNTGAATLNVNGLGAKGIQRNGSLALNDGDILDGQAFAVMYDGTQFQIMGRISTDWKPNSVPLGSLLSSGASFFINAGAGVYVAFDGSSDDSVFFNDALSKPENMYDGSDLALKLQCRISSNGGVGATVGLNVTYAIVKAGDNSSNTFTTIAQQDVDVSSESMDINFEVTLRDMTGVVDGETLMLTLTRNAVGPGSDTYAGQFEILGMELIKV